MSLVPSVEEQIVRCPTCNGRHSHISRVGTMVGSDSQEAVVFKGTQPIGRTSDRRSSLTVTFDCEECGDTFSLSIRQYRRADLESAMKFAFRVPGVPVAQPRQRNRVQIINGHPVSRNYTPSGHPVNTWKAAIQMAARAVYTGEPFRGPVILAVTLVFPRPLSMIWKRRPMPRVPHKSRPDLENVLKALMDALTGITYVDDAQVSSVFAAKFFAAGDEQASTDVLVEADTGVIGTSTTQESI